MECLNCGAPVLENGHCSDCGMNYKLLAKAYNTSNYYYNVGLDRACVRDLTGAIDALKLALKYNKQNINARNLLGLIYYETGETVTGLTQWVISNSYFPGENNIAGYYIKEVQADPVKLEEANQLAKQFNQALMHARQGTKDLAFIQLKRILSNYPHFVKGYLLLALLYMDSGNTDKAKKAIKRVLRIDKNNTLAVKYLAEMGVAPRDVIGMKENSRRIDLDSAYTDEDQYKSDLQTFVEKGIQELDDPDLSVGSYKEINHNKFNLMYVVVGMLVGVL
ncbi:MAG: tetratricopeptide repeat protein, partial [Lachnospiraceae bacterium]|nr:tetratricopeptide repeat protein [Lachnospiraceae bacterium]